MSFCKDRVCLIGVIKALDGISSDEVRTKMVELVNSMRVLPVMQNNLLRYEMDWKEVTEMLKRKADNKYTTIVLMEAEDNETLMKVLRNGFS
ncbi:hypothetical protein B0H19DRAFT_1268596 [Mycena capillaripes]|nr:hypothetical protein B0H19DRAFT_1268596 [Mycena capillaripes]